MTPPPTEDTQDRIREREQTKIRLEALRKMGDSGGLEEADLIKNSEKKVTLNKRDKELISINPEDEAKFAEFLKLPKTGFIRLHDSTICNENKSIINVDVSCPSSVTGKATAFSFRKQIYTVSVFSDIQNANGLFKIAGINQLGFLSNLGDTELEKLDLQSPGIKALAEFQASSNVKEIKYQYGLAKKGFQVGKFIYKADLPIKLNSSYVLRSIAYEGKAYRKFGNTKKDIFEGDERKDVVIVFRVIREHKNGSYGILWRELRRQNSPTIVAGK